MFIRYAAIAIVAMSFIPSQVRSQTPPQNKPTSKTPVYLFHNGSDKIGSEFFEAIKHEFAASGVYKVGVNEASAYDRAFRFYIELTTVEVPSSVGNRGVSAASVVIEEMGLPNSYPVANKWYHKLFLVGQGESPETARVFVKDVDASWCRHIKNWVEGCPKELIP